MTIYKYPISITEQQIIQMPIMPRILCVQVQHGRPCLWALVDENGKRIHRRILTRGTGHNASGIMSAEYIGTYQLDDGVLVFHVFDGGDVI